MITPRTGSQRDPDPDSTVYGDPARIATWLLRTGQEAGRIRRVLGTVSPADAAQALTTLDAPRAFEILLLLPPELAGAVLAELEPAFATELVTRLPSDERTDLLSAVEIPARDRTTACLSGALKAESARLLVYPHDTAGGLMETELSQDLLPRRFVR